MTPNSQRPSGHLRLAPRPSEVLEASPGEQTIRVVLADDHALMRRTLRLLLDKEEGVDVIAEAEDMDSVTRHVRGHRPEVLVLDFGMPGGSSAETIRRLREQTPDTQIVVLTMRDSPMFAQQALDAGAIGFVLKDSADSELSPAVRSAVRGQQFLSPRVATGLAAVRRSVTGDALTARETEVLRLTALGHTSAEIARQLRLSRRTVETHRAHIHRKLRLRTRAELVRFALRNGLIRT